MKSYSFITEGSKLKDFFLSSTSAMDLKKETVNTIKILKAYPTPEQLEKRLESLKNETQNPKIRTKLATVIIQLQNQMPMDKEEYYEFIRKHLSGASGFWKHLLYMLASPFGVAHLYKLFSVDKSVVNDSADDIIKKHAKGKLLFRG